MVKNWEDIHEDFTPELQKEWEEQGFSYEQAREWINAGLETEDVEFAHWLKNIRSYPSEWVSNSKWRDSFKKKFQEQLGVNWEIIHLDFCKKDWFWKQTYQQLWEKEGLNYQDAQEWIKVGFEPEDHWKVKNWKNLNFTSQEAKAWIEAGLDKWNAEFTYYLRHKGYEPSKDLNWKQIKENGILAQEYLDIIYPKNQRSTVKKLELFNKSLTEELDLNDFVNLEVLYCYDNKLTSLNLANCVNLKEITFYSNHLTEIKLPKGEKLETLNLKDNNLHQDLSFLKGLRNLSKLVLANNRFYGSLEPLKNMGELRELDISDTDIDSDLEYLPESVEEFYCSAYERKDAKCKSIYNLLENQKGESFAQKLKELKEHRHKFQELWKKNNFTSEEINLWKKTGLTLYDYNFAEYLKLNGCRSNQEDLNLTELKKQYQKDLENQRWFWEKIQGVDETILYQRWKQANMSKLVQQKNKPILKHLIGKGGYGEVYKGKWKLQDVAVKKLCLSPQNISKSDLRDIKREINILKSLKNRHIIQYYDAYSDDQEFFIIMDFAENGTLTKFINDNQNKEHDWNFNTKLIKQMTLGLAYIHHEGIIHRDLKSLNILLADNYQVKISDFGLSKINSISSVYSNDTAKGTVRWMAPELLKDPRKPKYSEQSDIYALGMIIWEIVAKCTVPFKNINDNILISLCIIRNEKEKIPNNTPQNIQHIIKKCWKDKPIERISLENILEKIETHEELNLSEINLKESQIRENQIFTEQSQEQQSSLQIQFSYGTPNLSDN